MVSDFEESPVAGEDGEQLHSLKLREEGKKGAFRSPGGVHGTREGSGPG